MPEIIHSVVFALACITLIPVSIAALAQPVPAHLQPAPTESQGNHVQGKEYAPPMSGDDYPQGTTNNGGGTR